MGIKRTFKERQFIEAYINNHGNATEAYLSLYPNSSREAAKSSGSRMLTKANFSNEELLNEMGMTDAYLHNKLDEGLNATKTISVVPIKPKEARDNDTDLPEATSKNIEFVDVNDYAVRHKYLDTAYKLKGKYPPTTVKNELTGAGGAPLNLIIKLDHPETKENG
jgi:hypothetical protein